MIGEALIATAGAIFGPVIVEAAIFVSGFTVAVKIIELLRSTTNLSPKGGE